MTAVFCWREGPWPLSPSMLDSEHQVWSDRLEQRSNIMCIYIFNMKPIKWRSMETWGESLFSLCDSPSCCCEDYFLLGLLWRSWYESHLGNRQNDNCILDSTASPHQTPNSLIWKGSFHILVLLLVLLGNSHALEPQQPTPAYTWRPLAMSDFLMFRGSVPSSMRFPVSEGRCMSSTANN